MNRKRWTGMAMISLVCGGLFSAGCGSSDDAAIAQGAPTDLSNVTQAWNKNLPAEQRFAVLASFANAAVLDKNTGLVWEQAPDATLRNWATAILYCVNKNVGGTVGWRLPSVVELKSVQDPTLPPPFVPASIFTGVESASYWSATSQASDPPGSWVVHFGEVGANGVSRIRTLFAWCVRGPMQESVL